LAESTSEIFGAITQKLDLEAHEFAWFHRPSRDIWRGTWDEKSDSLIGHLVTVEEV